MKFSNLEAQLREGTLNETDLESACVTPGDFLKMRADSQQWADGDGGPDKQGDRTYRYVFVTESPIGSFRDVPLANGWDLTSFRDRKSPVLLQHDGLPIGRAGVVRKNQDYNGVKALVGHVQFAPEGLSEVADMTERMVAGGLLNCGSVGFNIVKMREPTDAEAKQFKLGKYSAIFEKMSLSEYSVVAVGRDPKAGVIYSDEGASQFESMISGMEYSADSVLAVREAFLHVPTGKETITYESVDEWISTSDCYVADDEEEDKPDEFAEMRESIQALTDRIETLESPEVEEEYEEDAESTFDSIVASVCERYEN